MSNATLAEIKSILQRIHNDLPALINRAQVTPQQIVIVNGLSDLSERLGVIQAGEFRTGNSKEPGFGFSGVRIGYPPFIYNGELWHIAGVQSDNLNFGVRASDGTAVAGGGAVRLDANGIEVVISDSVSPIRSYQLVDEFGTGIADFQGTVNQVDKVNIFLNASSVESLGDAFITVRAVASEDQVAEAALMSWVDGHLSTAPSIKAKQIASGEGTIEVNQASLDLKPLSTTPGAPTANSDAKIYVRNNKLIVEFNDAGLTRFKYLDLTGSGVTWVHTTTGP